MNPKYRNQPDLDNIDDPIPPNTRTRPPSQPQRVEIVMPVMPQAIKTAAGLVCELLALVCRVVELACEMLALVARIVDTCMSWLGGICDRIRRYLIGIAHGL